jgi:hypothetical protein
LVGCVAVVVVVVVVMVCLSVGVQEWKEVVGAFGDVVVVFEVVGGVVAARGEQLGGFCLWMGLFRGVVVVGYAMGRILPVSLVRIR